MVSEETVEAISEKIEQTEAAAVETVRHPFVKRLARLGFYTKGFLFIVIGVLAALLAVGLQGKSLTRPARWRRFLRKLTEKFC
jgi:hypothetical protein